MTSAQRAENTLEKKKTDGEMKQRNLLAENSIITVVTERFKKVLCLVLDQQWRKRKMKSKAKDRQI